MNKKYRLTKNKKKWCGITLYQIEATASFGLVVKGELGGYIEKEANLSQGGNAWVYDNARVYGDARVSGDARVYGDARVSGNAWVSGDAWVYGDARVSGDAWVSGNARVSGKLKLLAGFFFGIRYHKEEIKFTKIDNDYELIYKGYAKFGEEDEKKTELLKKADELIVKAEELKSEANKL
jgi:hypothetical protein